MMERSGGKPREDLFYDHEHLTRLGFLVWANAIEDEVAKLFGDKPKKPLEVEDLTPSKY